MRMVGEKMGNMLGIKGSNKREKLKQLTAYYVKILKDGFSKNGVEGVCNIHL